MLKAILKLAWILALAAASNSFAQAEATVPAKPKLGLTANSWTSLDPSQKRIASEQFSIEMLPDDRFARIIHVQGINESLAGTSGGAQLGGALGQARYIDQANWRNYSATAQIGAGLLGALVGSLADRQAVASFRHVYTLRAPNGAVQVVQRTSGSEIYTAPGLCIDTASWTPVKDDYCESALPSEIVAILSAAKAAELPMQDAKIVGAAPAALGPTVCRLGSKTSVVTTTEKCLLAGGLSQP